eukprot:9236971-Pyramimonas_sp.AAC.1
MPEVDPLRPENEKLLEGKNTEACEQLNSWISGRTRNGLEMTRGHFQMHWWILFDAHNQWLEREAACKRRRLERKTSKAAELGVGKPPSSRINQ